MGSSGSPCSVCGQCVVSVALLMILVSYDQTAFYGEASLRHHEHANKHGHPPPPPHPLSERTFNENESGAGDDDIRHKWNGKRNQSGDVTFSKDVKYAMASQDFFKRYLTTTSTLDRRNGIGDSSSMVTSRSRMPYGLSKGLLDIRKANEHYLKVHTQARCREPKPHIVKVKEFYPDPTKEFLPSCTILHRCGDDTGCCDSDSMQCVAKRQEVVELHFYKLHLSSSGIGIGGADTVEKLSFVNDTECECQIVDDRPRFHVRRTMCLQCPSGFSLREQPHGSCSCDCFDREKSCLRMKRGREALPEADRRCVEARRCHHPECEHGLYDNTMGRCPKKSERKNAHFGGMGGDSGGGGGGGSGGGGHNNNWWRFDERE